MAVPVLLTAFGLRVGRLELQSLWYDEGSSVYLAKQSLRAITTGAAADIHPPLYYYLLHFWTSFAGQSEYAVRSLSVAAGTLVVALLFSLGRRLWGGRAGLFASACGAVSPLLVYYSQETRMYVQVTLFGLLATYLLERLTHSRSSKSGAAAPEGSGWLWLAYAAAMAACLYSQYIGALVLAFHGLHVLLNRRRAIGPFAGSVACAVLAFIPWLRLAGDSLLHWPSTNAFHAGPQLFADAAFRYVLGLSANAEPVAIGLTVVAAGLAAWGALAAARSRDGSSAALAALYVAVPLLAMFAAGYRSPVYNPKFALVALPGFALLLGVGLAKLPALGRIAGLAVVLLAAGYSLYGYYGNPAFARDDYRGIAEFITTSQRPGDAIILNAPGQEQIFPYYYHGNLPVVDLPADRPLIPDKTAATLGQLNSQYQRLWLVLYGTNGSDPNGFVEQWLAGKDYEIQNQWFGNVRLVAFAVPTAQAPLVRAQDATIGGFAHLSGYTLTPQPVASGEVLQLGLDWQAIASAPANDKVFTHLIDGDGNIWAQRDSDPAGGARPTGEWKPGDRIEDNYGLLVLPGTPPGSYEVEVGMYAPDSGLRLPVTAGGSGDRLVLGAVSVAAAQQPPSVAELRIPHPLAGQLGSLKLLGYSLTLVGQDTERDSFRAGDLAHLTLFWEAGSPLAREPTVSIQLTQGQTRNVLITRGLVPQQPATQWQPGERYRDQFRLHIPAAEGAFQLAVSVDGQPVTLASVRLSR